MKQEEYRAQVDAVSFSPDFQDRTMARLRELAQEKEKKTMKKAHWRTGLMAAAAAAVLVTAALAAEVMGFDFVRVFGGPEEMTVYVKIRGDDSPEEWEEMGVLYEVYGAGQMENIPLSELSPALQEIQEQYQNKDWFTEELSFNSWAEAEEFLGREIADNAVLEGAEYAPSTIWKDGKPYQKSNCIVGAFVKYGELSSVDLRAEYELVFPEGEATAHTGSATVDVYADLYIGEEMPSCPDYVFIDNGYWAVEEQESYLTANGLEAVIINVKEVHDGNVIQDGAYHAFFFLHGVRFRVEVSYWGPEDQEIVLAGLKEVLDNFK